MQNAGRGILRKFSGRVVTLAPTRAILIAQYRVCAVITIDGVGVVLKVCAMIEETSSQFEIYCAASICIAQSGVNIVQ
jgi:hypothetical protein